jgi:cell division protein FtsN
MARDYKGRASPGGRRQPRGSCIFWFTAGALVGAFAVGWFWLREGEPQQQSRPGATARSAQERPPKPQFDFYNLLPEMEVVVPDEPVSAPPSVTARAARPEPPPSPPPTVQRPLPEASKPAPPAPEARAPSGKAYLLQVASFRKSADAERLKARLALLGVQAQIQRVTINNNDTFHRVRTLPLRDRETLNATRALLKKNGLESVVILQR